MYVEGLKTSDIFISFQRTSYEITVTYTEGLCSRDLVTRVIISKNRTLRATVRTQHHSCNSPAKHTKSRSSHRKHGRGDRHTNNSSSGSGQGQDIIHHMLLEQKESPWDNLWPLEGARG